MFLMPFFNITANGIAISQEQASAFAKQIAGDFNPIHDVGAKRFCVPGDLLFALTLEKYGLSQQMSFNFEGMVSDGTELKFPAQFTENLAIKDEREKTYLKVNQKGNICDNEKQIEAFIRSYVAFSALNFIHILIPMMAAQNIMINPDRPLVIYDSMGFELESLDFDSVRLVLTNQQLKVSGKRGDALLEFALFDGEKQIGTGHKTLVLSGLRDLESEQFEKMCETYESRRLNFDNVS